MINIKKPGFVAGLIIVFVAASLMLSLFVGAGLNPRQGFGGLHAAGIISQDIEIPEDTCIPVFEFGRGEGNVGSHVRSWPLFMSEEDALAIITATFAEVGLTLSPVPTIVENARIPVTNAHPDGWIFLIDWESALLIEAPSIAEGLVPLRELREDFGDNPEQDRPQDAADNPEQDPPQDAADNPEQDPPQDAAVNPEEDSPQKPLVRPEHLKLIVICDASAVALRQTDDAPADGVTLVPFPYKDELEELLKDYGPLNAVSLEAFSISEAIELVEALEDAGAREAIIIRIVEPPSDSDEPTLDEWTDASTRSGTLTSDATLELANGMPVEFVSVDDSVDWHIVVPNGSPSGLTGSYDTKNPAETLAANNPGVVVFYDPVVYYDITNYDLIPQKPFESDGDFHERLKKHSDKKEAAAKAEAERLLRKQVLAFIDWLCVSGGRSG